MRILLDECIDWRLGREIIGHDVKTVPQAGWASLKNGELLRRAQAEFDAFLTTDRNLENEQNVPSFSIAIIVLCSTSNRLADLRRLVPALLSRLRACKPGTVTHIGGE